MILGIVAAAIVVSGIIALQIKSFRHYCRHREEEMRLNAETDSTPIQLPARGFSLVRKWASHGSINSHYRPQPEGASLTRGASVLRTLSQMGRLGSQRAVPTTDLENQITEYRGATAANHQDQTTASASTDSLARGEFYQTRGQQWGSQTSFHPTRSAPTPPSDGYHPVASRSSEDITEPIDPDVYRMGGTGHRNLPWDDVVAPEPTYQYEPFRREV